jgi:hypothetical protein
MSRVAIYTAIFGGYDQLIEQPEISGVDYVCFTDDPDMRSSQWDVRRARARYPHPRMSAKWFKALPQKALPEYSTTIWIDGGTRLLTPDFADVVLTALGDGVIALFKHPVRDTVRAEAEFCVPLPKYRDEPLMDQVQHYSDKGFADDRGLFAGGILGRNRHSQARKLGRLWLRENRRWSYQDQLSLPYLFWKLDIEPAVIPYPLWGNGLFDFVEHASEL